MIIDRAKYVGRAYDGDNYHCWHLCMSIYEDNGITLPDFGFTDDSFRPSAEAIREVNRLVEGECKRSWVQVDEPEIGDVVLFEQGRRRHHAGIYVGNQQVIHNCPNVKQVVIQRVRAVTASGRKYWRYTDGKDSHLSESS